MRLSVPMLSGCRSHCARWHRTIEIPGFSFFHDMAITRKHALFVQGSFDFNPLPFVLGFKVRGDRS